jgi:hypothetical protein
MKRSVLILSLLVLLLLAACAPAQTPPANTEVPPQNSTVEANAASLTQVDDQGAVTVEVTPINLDQPGDTLLFDVAMNTHSVDLSMDLKALATLTTDTGLTIPATNWEAPLGGHHVSGKLSFPAAQSGKSILDGAKKLTLTITGIDNATRTFNWDLTAK